MQLQQHWYSGGGICVDHPTPLTLEGQALKTAAVGKGGAGVSNIVTNGSRVKSTYAPSFVCFQKLAYAPAAPLSPTNAGLTLQLAGIGMLFGWQESWAANGRVAQAIVFVTAAQMLCGVAKDLTKLGGKTVTKLVTPDEKQVRMYPTNGFQCVLGLLFTGC
jgi:hypothetical protein